MTIQPTDPRVVLVVGGNRGIGSEIAEAFAAQGDRVAVTHRKEPLPGLTSVRCDVTSTQEVGDAVDEVERRLGPVEVLVANAGITHDELVLRMRDEDFVRVLDTNLVGTYRVVKRVARPMVRSRWGRIVLISSVAALSGSPGQCNYAASKAGMVGFARSLARELGRRNITVNVVAPGFIDTDMTRPLPAAHRDRVVGQVPLQRVGTTADVAGAVCWLASPAASYVTGAVIPVDGGLGMGH